jgi:hypothetical protein
MLRHASLVIAVATSLVACFGGDDSAPPPPADQPAPTHTPAGPTTTFQPPPKTPVACVRTSPGGTSKTASCTALPVASTELPENFRSHVAFSTSLGGSFLRLTGDFMRAMENCVYDALSRGLLGDRSPKTCDQSSSPSASAQFSGGVYTLAASDDIRFLGRRVNASEASATARVYNGTQLLTADLRDPNSYLVAPRVGMDGDNVVLSFDAPGPLAGLLGFGDAPASPIVLTASDAQRLGGGIGALGIEGELHTDLTDCNVHSTIDIGFARTPISDALANGLPAKLTKGVSEKGTEKLSVTTWDLVDVGTGPKGTVAFDIGGSAVASGMIAFAGAPAYSNVLTMTCATR